MIDWTAVTAIATVISTIVFIVSALYVRAELQALDKDRFLSITNQLFEVWQSPEFMDAQLWIEHTLEAKTWEEFVKKHRPDNGEAVFHRVGSFYDRVGTLVRLGLIRREQVLPTIAGYAIKVWQKIQPLVNEARQNEHSTLFLDFEQLMPACIECYAALPGTTGQAPSLTLSPLDTTPVPRISIAELEHRLQGSKPPTLVDARQPQQVAQEPRALPAAILIPLAELEARYRELRSDREVVVYCA
jgi:hypothetical protein